MLAWRQCLNAKTTVKEGVSGRAVGGGWEKGGKSNYLISELV